VAEERKFGGITMLITYAKGFSRRLRNAFDSESDVLIDLNLNNLARQLVLSL
jgi:hypothetical protein